MTLSHTYQDPENHVWRVTIIRDGIHHSVECLREDGRTVYLQDNRLEPIEKITGTFIDRYGTAKACRFIRVMPNGSVQVAYVDSSGNKLRGFIRWEEFKRDAVVEAVEGGS